MERIVEIEQFDAEEVSESTLRPDAWNEYIGQEQIKKNLGVFIEASKMRDEALDHTLFYGDPTTGGPTTNPNFLGDPVAPYHGRQPYRSESFILLSAGPDGLYGTADDVYNFDTE